jgi:hypothetical protein
MENLETYTNEKGEVVVIAQMESIRLIHAIAKYASIEAKDSPIVKALKAEAIKRLSESKQ